MSSLSLKHTDEKPTHNSGLQAYPKHATPSQHTSASLWAFNILHATVNVHALQPTHTLAPIISYGDTQITLLAYPVTWRRFEGSKWSLSSRSKYGSK